MRRLSSSPAVRPSFVEDRRHVLLDGALGDAEAVAAPLFERPSATSVEHVVLARGERGQPPAVGRCRQQLRDDLRIERAAAGGDAPQAAGELVDVRDAVLEQVPEPSGRSARSCSAVPASTVCDRITIPCRGWRGADRLRGPQPFVGVGGRHPDVDDRGVGRVVVDRAAAARRRRPPPPRPRSPARRSSDGDALAHQQVVVGDHDPHGSSALTTVPAPAGLVTSSRPASASTRSCEAAAGRSRRSASAPPMPSSAISIATPCRRSRVPGRREAASRARTWPTLASASQATKYSGELDRARQFPSDVAGHGGRHRRAGGQRRQRRGDALVEHGGMDAAGQLAQLLQRVGELARSPASRAPRRRRDRAGCRPGSAAAGSRA